MTRRKALGALAATPLAGATAPRQSPEFAIKGPTRELLLSQLRGRNPVLLFLFFTTCPHCQKSAGLLNRLQAEYGPRGLQVLGCAFDPNAQWTVANFLRTYRVGFPAGYNTRAAVLTYLNHPLTQPLSVPIFVFIDRKGRIRAQHIGSDPFFKTEEKSSRAMIETLLKEK